MKLRGLPEDRLVALLLRGAPAGRDLLCGPGDDCAVIGRRGDRTWALLKTDCVLEGVHFRPQDDPRRIGWKALARAVSDIAAMGGEPRHALITMAAAPDTDVARARGIYSGLYRCARAYGIGIAGGETARSPGGLFISITLTGQVEKARCVFRSGGRGGDRLFVTGRLGGSLAKRHLRFHPRVPEARWLTKHFRLRAMMDLSDGLGADLPRLARASGCGFALDESALPLHRGCTPAMALADGEDYELLFAVAPRDAPKLAVQWSKAFPKLPLSEIGRLTPRGKGAASNPASLHGFDHFA